MRTLLLIGTGMLLLSCSNEIDLFGPAEETPVVWSLLNGQDSIHYVRLQRSFQSEGVSGLISAADPNKIYYPSDSVVLEMGEWIGGLEQRRWNLERVIGDSIGLPKETGLFAGKPNVLYRFKAALNPDAEYRLRIERLGPSTEYTARTLLVKPFAVFYAANPDFPIDYADTGSFNVLWASAVGGRLYDGFFQVHYDEWQEGIWQSKTTEYPIFRNQVLLASDGPVLMQVKVQNFIFYTGLRSVLPPLPPGRRRFTGLDLNILAAGEEVYLLYLNNQTLLGISALYITPTYTNLDGGLGIFSSRSVASSRNIPLTQATLDSLACGGITRALGFERPAGPPGSETCP
ncbi:MAG: hypothetical protein GC205_10810 [Bacteroidetes bacterium]|nr:hypothetical protein [Bacteroidota bacterium]